jgi:uncharacterized iron-regulated membrane protein
MKIWDRWIRHPQRLWPRKALFQIHLWTGIGLGLYVLVMSVSGVALLYRREVTRKFGTAPQVTPTNNRLSADQLKQAAERDYPGYEIQQYIEPRRRNAATRPVEIWLARGRKMQQRFFDPYTGADLGPSVRIEFRIFQWVADLHDNLLLGMRGLVINGIGGMCVTLLCLTGVVIWWPGIENWRRSLMIDLRANSKRLNWSLHSAFGFWSVAFVLMWGVSGIYLAFPTPFQWVADSLTPADPSSKYFQTGNQALAWLARLHFGRFAGLGVEIVWTALGLAPVVLFVTGAIMWWNRVLRPWLTHRGQAARKSAAQTQRKRPERQTLTAP